MMIDKTELLRMIMEANPKQSPAFILEQFSAYLKGLTNITGECLSSVGSSTEKVDGVTDENADNKQPKTSITCGFVRRKLKVKPEGAIQRDKIICCICGQEGQIITERHLAKHNGLTREGYIKLCGYPKNQSLMSENHLLRMKSNVKKAQNERKNKSLRNKKEM